jgi:hypothetical protein
MGILIIELIISPAWNGSQCMPHVFSLAARALVDDCEADDLHGCKKQNEKKRTKAKNKNKNNRTRGSAFCLWRSAQRQTADGRRQTHGVQTPTTNLGQLTHLTGCVTTSHTPRQQQKRPEIRSLPSFPPFSAP